MRVNRNSHKLKIPLATTICGEDDFVKRGVLAHPLIYESLQGLNFVASVFSASLPLVVTALYGLPWRWPE